MRFSGKHVVVTGAASGLGLAIAEAAQAEGAVIIAIDRAASPFENSRICDIADEDQVRRALSGLPRLDAVVNSAGIARRAKVDETEMADFDAVMAVNVRGAFLVSKYALPQLRSHGGAILHLSSGVATTGTRNRAAYTASKGAILSLTLNMALDYAADRVRVNCLCPGFVNTPLLASMPAQRRARLAALHPLGRMGEAQDIAPMALFLISDQASWITGQAIAVDGGYNIGHMDDI
ncbi:MAG TPA: SDR family NAD(P)-dependent oxidoreductase [Rhizomicrobium sp.]|jgi:NAD(P)-dependent dehydrogenase (short-subunit alcohol dehydrogenase family)|nr:SDR family NAD(P)-dependent oxidoreductase [Rhizomicrobium sp.]